MKTANKHFTDLAVWQEGHNLALFIYGATKSFPRDEQFALTNQLRRAATSVPSNIAEGFNRFSLKEKIQFYAIAMGSVSEVHSQLLLARDLAYLPEDAFIEAAGLVENIHKQLTGLIRSLRSKP